MDSFCALLQIQIQPITLLLTFMLTNQIDCLIYLEENISCIKQILINMKVSNIL